MCNRCKEFDQDILLEIWLKVVFLILNELLLQVNEQIEILEMNHIILLLSEQILKLSLKFLWFSIKFFRSIVSWSTLYKNKICRSEKLTKLSCSNTTHCFWLKTSKNYSAHKYTSYCFFVLTLIPSYWWSESLSIILLDQFRDHH
jgi:hypothetical protein